ncbi:hypothetical protein NHX12_004130 [Muraenolepis orangiensis]|uniref:Uncharacterized protein n=1 Tax=Muraenolepis orangiensis TaxID=630683 RepID=A0A9Q0DTV6_9TELE|nr:hypothetical protein NHX12_004130 [Muraenolepis orangiensis]
MQLWWVGLDGGGWDGGGQGWRRTGMEADGDGGGWGWRRMGMEVDRNGGGRGWRRTGMEVDGDGGGRGWRRTGMEADGDGGGRGWRWTGMAADGDGGGQGWRRVLLLLRHSRQQAGSLDVSLHSPPTVTHSQGRAQRHGQGTLSTLTNRGTPFCHIRFRLKKYCGCHGHFLFTFYQRFTFTTRQRNNLISDPSSQRCHSRVALNASRTPAGGLEGNPFEKLPD